jgi:hypothetical protein
MVKVRLNVSATYEGEHAPGDDVVCDVEFARRTVLFGHAVLLENDAPMTFEAACQALRVSADDLAATADIRAASQLNGG